MPRLIGGIIIYELVITIILLIFILWELEKPCGCCCADDDQPGSCELTES